MGRSTRSVHARSMSKSHRTHTPSDFAICLCPFMMTRRVPKVRRRAIEMAYPEIPNFKLLTDELTAYAQMKHEYGAKGTGAILRDVERRIKAAAAKLNALPTDRQMARREPN